MMALKTFEAGNEGQSEADSVQRETDSYPTAENATFFLSA